MMGRRVIGISGSLIWSKTLMELILNPYGEFRWNPEGPVGQIHSPHLHVGAPGIFSDLLRSVEMLEWGAESNGKLPHLFIPSETATWFLSLRCNMSSGRTAALVPEFAMKNLPLDRTLWWWWWMSLFLGFSRFLNFIPPALSTFQCSHFISFHILIHTFIHIMASFTSITVRKNSLFG